MQQQEKDNIHLPFIDLQRNFSKVGQRNKKEAVLIKIPCLKNFFYVVWKYFLLNMFCDECKLLARGIRRRGWSAQLAYKAKVFNRADQSTESSLLVPKLVTNIRVWKTKNQYTDQLHWQAGFKMTEIRRRNMETSENAFLWRVRFNDIIKYYLEFKLWTKKDRSECEDKSR